MSPDTGKFSGQYLIPHSSRLQVSARGYLIAAAISAFVALGASGASAQSADDSIVGEPGPTTIVGPIVGPKVTPKLSGPARDLPPAPPPSPEEVNPLQGSGAPPIFRGPKGIVDPVGQFSDSDSLSLDQPADLSADAGGFAPNQLGDPIVNVAGQGGRNPNDTNGDVGPNDFVQMKNATFQIFDKQGVSRGPAANINTLWTIVNPADTSECAIQNIGDPIVLYDKEADRWLLSQFAKNISGSNADPGYICVAISQTPDPTGAYFLYQFTVDRFPDYYKIGVWPDGYYVSANFNGPNEALAAVMDRANMLNGNPAGIIEFAAPTLVNDFDILIPSTMDGETPPPAGTPNFMYRQVDEDIIGGGLFDRLELWEFHVDWATPLASTFTGPTNIPTAPFSSDTCGYGFTPCIEQPGTAQLLDAIQIGTMYRFPYRNFGDREVLVGNFTVDATGDDGIGIRWFELERIGAGPWAIANEGTYAPQPVGAPAFIHRWMGSAAMDRFGNIALGYTASSAQNVFPSARYTGRVASDPLGLLPQPEKTIQAGLGFTTSNRWGDYYTMSVDPVDDCTFWYTGDATAANGSRQSRIASFRFSECAADLRIAKSDSPDPVLAGTQLTYTITVTNDGPLDATNVVVTDTLPAGVSYVADSLLGSECNDTSEPTIGCNLGDLFAGNSTSFTITVAVDSDILFVPDGPIEIENSAIVDMDQDDSDESNNSVSEVTLVNESADLIVTKICKPDGPEMAGGTAFCEIFVDNAGPSGARNVTLVDAHLSEGSFSISGFSASQGVCAETPTGTVACDLLDIDAGERVTITVDITSDDSVDVNDKATVASDTPDPDSSNNMDEGKVSFLANADLSITKSDAPDPVTAGEQLIYTLTVMNHGPSTALNVVVEDDVPAGVTIDSVVPAASCNAGVAGVSPTVCGVDVLANGDSTIVTITVTVLPDTTGILSNDARVSSATLDPDNSNNFVNVNTKVQADSGLVITKSDVPDSVLAGNELTYTVTATNNGPSTATMVDIVDSLPAEVSFLSAQVTEGTANCSEAANVVTCIDGDLDPGEMLTVVITVRVDSSTPDGTTITNNADVLEEGAVADSVSEDTLVNAEADLWIDKTGNFPTGNPSGTILYFLTVYNTAGCSEDDPQVCSDGGPSDALNVVVTDELPSTAKKLPVEFVSENCSYDKGTHTVTCTEPVLAAGDFVTFEIQVRAKGSLGEIENEATVDSSTTDPVSGNNTDLLLMTVKGGTGDSGGPGGNRGRGGGPKK